MANWATINLYLDRRKHWLVCGATILYVIYVFAAQWSSAAMRMDDATLRAVFSLIVNVCYIGSCALTFLKVAIDIGHYRRQSFLFYFLLGSVALIGVTVQTPSLVLPLLIGFSSLNITNRMLAKIIVIAISLLLAISCVLSLHGLTGGDKNTKPLLSAYDGTYEMATSIGLGNPNSAMMISFSAIVLALYLCRTNLQYIITSAAAFVFVVGISSITGSTTGIIIGTLSIFIMSLSRYRKRVRRVLARITPYMFFIVTIASFFTATTFGYEDNSVSRSLTGRPELWNLRIENGTYLNLIGNKDVYETDYSPDNRDGYRALDNMPLFIIVQYGIVIFMLFAYIFYVGSRSIKDYGLLVLIFMSCLMMFSERMPLYGFVLIFAMKAIVDSYLDEEADIKKRRLWDEC